MTDVPEAKGHLRVLCLEDSPRDAELVGRTLTAAGYELDMDLAVDRGRFEELLAGDAYDIILADFALPGFNAHAALELATAACPLTPFVCVSGTIGEEATVELLKEGAVDCVLKDRVARLPFAVQRAIDEKVRQRQQEEAVKRLAAAAVEWRQTVDAMRDSIAVLARDGRVLRCNAATRVLTGRRFDEILGRACHEVFHGTKEYHPDCPRRRTFESGHAETSFMEQDGQSLRVTFEPEIDAAGHVSGGVHVVTDVTGLKQTERQLLVSISKQRAITDGVITALARTVEARDPYTAGHERRVSEFATALARHLELDEEQVQGVQVAGKLHDVGKITVPAEILSKPSRLSAIEFELIKGHAQAGFDVLESIDFPWPVAKITLQHHERLDGSGYPAGLRGDEILPEARILAVADVVEAMISHRPYRAALPLDAAMTELEAGAGSRYDAAACEAAGLLLRTEGFTFSE